MWWLSPVLAVSLWFALRCGFLLGQASARIDRITRHTEEEL